MIDKLNAVFKGIKGYEELISFKDKLENGTYGCYYILQMKRSKKKVNEIFLHHYNKDRVEYVIDDGVSTGNSLISNLSRNIEIVENGNV